MKTPAENGRPNISEFPNYRSFLKALYAYQKSKNQKISFQNVAKKMGTNPSYLKHVFEERRHIGLDRISKILSVFGLSTFESDYFTILVMRDLTTEPQLKERLSGILGGISFGERKPGPFYTKTRTSEGAYVVGNWLAAAICALVKFSEFQPDPKWIRSQLLDGEKLTEGVISSVLNELVERGILFREEGKWNCKDLFGIANPYQSTSLQIYRESIEKTWEILGDPAKYRTCQFYVETCALDRDGELEIINAFQEYTTRVTDALKKSKSPDRVVHFSNNLFTLVRNY